MILGSTSGRHLFHKCLTQRVLPYTKIVIKVHIRVMNICTMRSKFLFVYQQEIEKLTFKSEIRIKFLIFIRKGIR